MGNIDEKWVSHSYDTIAHEFVASRGRVWPELYAVRDVIRPGSNVLDIGCGGGRLLRYFEQDDTHAYFPVHYTGLDISPAMIARARDAFPESDDRKFMVGSATSLPFEDCTFDAIVSVAVFHHMTTSDDRHRFAQEAYRVLRPGGVLWMTNWNFLRPDMMPVIMRHIPRWIFPGNLKWGDVIVPWGAHQSARFYHVLTHNSIGAYMKGVGFTSVHGSSIDRGAVRRANMLTIALK